MKIPSGKKRCSNCFSEMRYGKCPYCGYSKNHADGEMFALPRGTKLAKRYITGGCVGRGGFGITYLAYDTRNRKKVAVKEYFPSMLAERGGDRHVVPHNRKSAELFNSGAERFFDEAALVCRFNGNPNIVSIYECFYENNTAYYVMEYLDGITLENYVKKYGVLSSGEAFHIAGKITMALLVLHSGNVLHRDISPDNVMLLRDGSVKLIDFGAARQFVSDGTYTVVMKTGFSPIEQYVQGTGADVRTDIYSLGTMLYYALTGRVPESPYQRLRKEDVFSDNCAGADEGFWNVIQKAAAVMPEERYSSAEEIRGELSKLAINAVPATIPDDYSFLREGGATAPAPKRTNISWYTGAAVTGLMLCISAVILFIWYEQSPAGIGLRTGGRFFVKQDSTDRIELILDREYKGNFKIAGRISTSYLLEFESDVEITLFLEPWENMIPGDILGLIPVNADGKSLLQYLTAEGGLWADENGYINIEKDCRELKFVLSREGIESLGGSDLGFESLNLIITSAVMEASEEKNALLLHDYKSRNAAYNVTCGENGKVVTAELDEYGVTPWGAHETLSVPKSAFYEFDGDVKMTVTFEHRVEAAGASDGWQLIYVYNSGFCWNVFIDDIIVPEIMKDGEAMIRRDNNYAILPNVNCNEIVVIVPKDVKDKMSGGLFFLSINAVVKSVRLEDYGTGVY